MREYCIVILNRFPELAHSCITSIVRCHKHLPSILVVCDRHQVALDDCMQRYLPGPFVFAKNVNVGFDSFPDSDIVLLNDDTTCVQEDFFPRLQEIAYKNPLCGILSPLIDGGVGNELQQYPEVNVWKQIKTSEIILPDRTICFPCAYIKRELIERIGGLDETFIGYGFDDDDYCIRAREVGWYTMITRSLRIQHGSGGNQLFRGSNWSSSFARLENQPESNIERFLAKYPKFRNK